MSHRIPSIFIALLLVMACADFEPTGPDVVLSGDDIGECWITEGNTIECEEIVVTVPKPPPPPPPPPPIPTVPGGGDGDTGGDDGPPEGIDHYDWIGLNDEEKRLCRENRIVCAMALSAAKESFNWSERQPGITGAHNGPEDAIRHAYWSARMTNKMGASWARRWGNAHEWGSRWSGETAMDQYNNARGREIGQIYGLQTMVAAKVLEALYNGTLQPTCYGQCSR